ncbi:imidazolonepropionase [Mangrovibacterium marinum]|uniref:Imidazolonepropionase n=1 Tax=Mangrovibacterium marinum TaxID=1639118 RepID=A0A2T5BY50_9BACT|nr:imidazolonepropionase [Mangrovibacterium marinum]PTN06749.1 imidazolonepropionase [Mangrovibacterium marinum]
MRIVLENIKELVQVAGCGVRFKAGKEMASLSVLRNAYLVMRDGIIEGFGPMKDLNDETLDNDVLIELDCSNRVVMPSFCDSHTHLVYAASREQEFTDRIKGLSYEEIAKRGGGILNSAEAMARVSEEELYDSAMRRLHEIAMQGTGAVEIKSGYGLSTATELKMLRVIRRLKKDSPMVIKATFLGAHAVPEKYGDDRSKYIGKIIHEMLPVIAAEDLADYIDVFCDQGFFTPLESEQILMAGMKHGLRPKVHANELGRTGGVQVGVKYNALSVDHLEHIGADEIEALKGRETMPTVLPGAAFFLNLPYSPVREMIDSGLPVALASDYNPGSSPSGNMSFMAAMGCIKYNMSPEEVINATTINSAYAMGVDGICGSICAGKMGNVFITKEIPSYSSIPYHYATNLIETVILDGQII